MSDGATQSGPERADLDSELGLGGQIRAAVGRFAVVSAVFLGLWLIPYAHPALEAWRYLDNLDASPLIRAARFEPPPDPAATMPGGLGTGAAPGGDELSDDELAALDPTLGEGAPAHADPPPADGETPTPAADAAGAEPSPSEDAGAAQAAPGRDDPPPADATANEQPRAAAPNQLPEALRFDPKAMAEPAARIEHAERVAPFLQAMVALAKGQRPKVRVRHYGDSHLANDGISHVLRVLLQRRFGDGGHGFVIARSGSRWFRHKGVRISSSDGWKSRAFIGGGFPDGHYGYGGEASSGGSGQTAQVQTAAKGQGQQASQIALWWRGGKGDKLQLEVDGDKREPWVGEGEEADLQSVVAGLSDGAHKVRVRVARGKVRLYGWVVERERGLVWDSLGIVGARARRWLQADASHIAAQTKARGTDLVVLNYGANSRNDKISEEKYAKSFAEVLQRLRPDASEPCLIVGPGDHGKKQKGKIVSDPRTVQMVGWQRKIADDLGCAFLDARKMMGGDGAMGRWVKQGLGWADYAHLTPRGQAQLGRDLYAALMFALAAHVRAE